MRTICIEGIDAVGKETVSKALEKQLTAMGFRCYRVSFPEYDGNFGRAIKDVLTGACGDATELDPNLFGSLYTLDRMKFFKERMSHLVESCDFLILDRSYYSNFMYQCSKYFINDPNNNSTNCELSDSTICGMFMWLMNNAIYELYETDLICSSDIDVFLLELPEKDRQAQISERAEKDIHESNTDYLDGCRKFSKMMTSKAYTNQLFDKFDKLMTEYQLQYNGSYNAVKNYYFDKVHRIPAVHALSKEYIPLATMANVNKILGYIFPDDIDDSTKTTSDANPNLELIKYLRSLKWIPEKHIHETAKFITMCNMNGMNVSLDDCVNSTVIISKVSNCSTDCRN